MKRVLRFLIGFLALPVCAQAQTTFGYTNGDFDRDDGVRLCAGTTQRAAIRMSAEKLSLLAGAKVTAIRSVFGTRNLNSVTFFITSDLDGEPLYEQQLSGSFSTRWAKYELTTPFEIPTGSELYFGLSIDCGESYYPLAFDRQYGEPGCVYGLTDDGWADISSQTYGNLNLQLMVEGAQQFTDASVRLFRADGYYKAGSEYAFEGQLYNFGTQPITSFDVTYSVGGGEEQTYSVSGVNIAQGAVYNFPIEGLEADGQGYKDMELSVTNVSGDVDAAPADNSRSQEMFFYPADMTRSFLVENFTGQECNNCPGGHAAMEEAIERSGMDVVSVSYHSGYNPDAFTMLEDYYYQTFYGVKGAPSFMVNRFANPAIDPSSPVFEWNNMTVAMITDCLEKQAAEQPYVGVNINTNYDEATRRLTGKVDVVAYRKPQMANPSLQLLLVQDSIVGNQALGGSNYVHRHVNRGSLNGYFGEKLGEMADGATVTKEIDYTLPESIMSTYDGNMSKSEDIPTDPKQMYLVAIVGNYNADDPADCLVLNCAAVKFGASTASGIAELPAAQAGASARLVGSAGSLRAEGNFDALYIYNVGGKLAARCTAPGQTLSLEPGVYVTRAVKGGAVSTAKCVVAR